MLLKRRGWLGARQVMRRRSSLILEQRLKEGVRGASQSTSVNVRLAIDSSRLWGLPLFSRLALLAICALQFQTAVAQVTVGFDEVHKPIVMTVPDRAVALQVDVFHLKVDHNELDQSATRRRILASNGLWVFSAFIYPLERKQTAPQLNEEARVALQKAAPKDGFKIEPGKTYTRGEFSMREYIIPEFRGQAVHQKNVVGFAVAGDMGVDFHISKVSYSAADDRFFDSLINGVRLVQDYKPDGTLEFGYGSVFYLRQDWKRASAHYEKALQLEKQKRTLTAAQWNVLVDNLGMAYGMSGDMPKAKTIFQYGVEQNPTYPMFHYNLACVASESGDLDSALEQLKLAFQYKSNSNPGEGMPDPKKDDSFKRYLTDAKFTKLANELCPNSQRTEVGWTCR